MFKTRADCELCGVCEQANQDEDLMFPLFETIFFKNYFIVDGNQVINEEGETFEMRRRFFLSRFTEALVLLNDFKSNDINHKSIALLQGSNISENADYLCSIIKKVIHCKDAAGQNAWIYVLKNGKTIVDCLIDQKEDDLDKQGVVYENHSISKYGKNLLNSY